ncbi:MAG: hypothetical protein AABX02_03330 [archaeon]
MMNRFSILAILVVGIFLLSGCTSQSPNAPPVQNQTNTTPPTSQPDNTPTPPILPSSGTMSVSVSPEAPVAGDTVTVTAALLPQYDYPGWQNNTTYSIWIRQFGNWKTVDCTDSPCMATYESVSTGNFEYQIRRTDSTGNVTTDGAFSLTVQPSVINGDTLGPKTVLFFEPGHPYVGTKVTITASVNDVSSVDKAEIYLDGAIIKTCDVNVKILQCITTASDIPVGEHILYAVSYDTFGNTTKTDEQSLVIYANTPSS